MMKILASEQLQQEQEEAPHLLLMMPWGVGDTISVGLSAVDQIRRNDPDGRVKIEVVCNDAQAELLQYDPRIYRIIQANSSLFPTNEGGSWKRGFFLPPATAKLAAFLRDQHYAGVLPFEFAPTLFYRLHTRIVFLSLPQVWRLLSVLHSCQEVSMQTFIRESINNFFDRNLPEPSGDEAIPLYICREHVRQAVQKIDLIKAQSTVPAGRVKVLLVSPDTSSVITRPPTALLAEGIAGALERNDDLFVALLPGYADEDAAPRLLRALDASFPGRIVTLPTEPKMPLPELAAFIDQCDILVCGDTSVMHLAVATKKIRDATGPYDTYMPRNAVKIIVLYGGTHPGIYGYSKRTLKLGKWRKEQHSIAPGLTKEIYNPRGKNLFDHIAPGQLTDAILSQV